MSDPNNNSTTARVSRVVQKSLAERGVMTLPGADRDLLESGLNSIGLVVLMLAIEAEFDIEIPEADMVPDNFRSITSIEALVVNMVSAA